MRPDSGFTERSLATLLFAALCLYVFVSILPSGLWEDGYFFLRYARNTWHAGVAAWNVQDGPAQGMTSQIYQLLVTLLYPLAPRRLVTLSKLLSALALWGAAFGLFRWRRSEAHVLARSALAFLGLGLPLVLAHMTTGLETLLVLGWLAWWVRHYDEFCAGRSSAWVMALFIVGTYLLRPDATLIPCAAMLPCLLDDRRRSLSALLLGALGLACFLGIFRVYYGTALPLAFYVKSYWSNHHGADNSVYFVEKLVNLGQFLIFYAPFLVITWRGRAIAPGRYSALATNLLGAALLFCAYHALFTVETMGHMSRFYMPAVVPIVAAAMVSYASFLERTSPATLRIGVVLWLAGYAALELLVRRTNVFTTSILSELFWLAAMVLVLLASELRRHKQTLFAFGVLLLGVVATHPVTRLTPEIDRVILRRQIKPRAVFNGLLELAAINPKNVYHTDMGAPGVLLPDAIVTDIDGLLNEELLIEHKSFAELCARDRPDGIFVPTAQHYPRLRAEILASPCYKNYRPLPTAAKSRLVVRADRLAAYRAAAAKLKRDEAAARSKAQPTAKSAPSSAD